MLSLSLFIYFLAIISDILAQFSPSCVNRKTEVDSSLACRFNVTFILPCTDALFTTYILVSLIRNVTK